MSSPAKENYLKAIYALSNELENVTLSKLSERLRVSNPTANSMIKSLKELNWVNYEKYRPISLTDEGKKQAVKIVRRHRLAEMFLVEKMGFNWSEVHDIAEEMEHIKSSLFFDRMDEILGFPERDPHGSPIPDKQGKVLHHNFSKLSEASVGSKVRLMALGSSSRDFLKFLDNRNLELGTEIKVKSIEAFDQSMEVSYNSLAPTTFSRDICDRLLVLPL
ncbi:MAG: metal-dependent transcriptional regulator [Flavobacteriales bacterium]|nr:metal-dependent transcriptional regulator [Flavobacteriales bacterium]